MAVVGPRGLVGKTTKALWSSTEVILISDPQCKVPCRTAGGTNFGILEGMGLSAAGRKEMEMLSAVNPIRMDYVPIEMPLQAGDVVETSGLCGILPAGIAVGRVTGVEMDRSGLYQRAEVAPFSDLSALRYAFVLKPAGRGQTGGGQR
jgi:rod shape-determining protein MreC